ncbi:MAG: hypothetical protein N3B01_06340 [Verrucomicrobiae bacterium]|nr:hypothetical protein [Verrucomicrobiae bacterium]
MNAPSDKSSARNISGQDYRISGPYTHENLSVFLIHGTDVPGTDRYVTLKEALQQQKVIVQETGSVGELLIENQLEDKDVFVQSGEILRGGRQDRTIRVDVVVPAKSKIPFPTFCVESGRWHRRGHESDAVFSSSNYYLAMKSLKLASKMHANQGAVWREVAEAQAKLAFSLGEPVCSSVSPSSLELTLDHEKVVQGQRAYTEKLRSLASDHPDAVGFAFAINGELNSAEIYASHNLFAAYWDKLLGSAAVEALAERSAKQQPRSVTAEDLQRLLTDADPVPRQTQPITDRVKLHTRRTPTTALFDTEDTALPGAILHRQYIWYCEGKPKP